MEAQNATVELESFTKPKKSKGKIALYVLLAIVALLVIWHFVFVSGGSGKWELAIDQDGVTIQTLKTPGNPLIKVKATTRVKAQLSAIAKLIIDADSCDEGDCYDSRLIERIDTPTGYSSYNTFRFDFPAPLKTREYVVKLVLNQDPQSKVINATVTAATDRLPADDCCVRVPYLNNVWQIRPLGNGELEVELIMDLNAGGNMPYVLANLGSTYGGHEFFKGLQGILAKDKFKNIKRDYITD
jgi:hypothetical protein